MRDHVFADPAAKRTLEALLHPMIREESARRIAAASGAVRGARRAAADRVAPTIASGWTACWSSTAPEETQVARVRARSGLSEDEVRAIMRAQTPRAARLAAADDVIDNSGTRDALRKQVAALHKKYLQFAQS